MYKMKEFYVIAIEDEGEMRYLAEIELMDYRAYLDINDALQFNEMQHAYYIADYLNKNFNTCFEVLQITYERKSTFTEDKGK